MNRLNIKKRGVEDLPGTQILDMTAHGLIIIHERNMRPLLKVTELIDLKRGTAPSLTISTAECKLEYGFREVGHDAAEPRTSQAQAVTNTHWCAVQHAPQPVLDAMLWHSKHAA